MLIRRLCHLRVHCCMCMCIRVQCQSLLLLLLPGGRVWLLLLVSTVAILLILLGMTMIVTIVHPSSHPVAVAVQPSILKWIWGRV